MRFELVISQVMNLVIKNKIKFFTKFFIKKTYLEIIKEFNNSPTLVWTRVLYKNSRNYHPSDTRFWWKERMSEF